VIARQLKFLIQNDVLLTRKTICRTDFGTFTSTFGFILT
jgi:hypothetical protein